MDNKKQITLKRKCTNDSFNKGDYVLFSFIDDEMFKGYIVEKKEKTCIIEICFNGLKSEDLKREIIETPYSSLVPLSFAFSKFNKLNVAGV